MSINLATESTGPNDQARRQTLSLLADGEADTQQCLQASQWWREDESTRVTWHAYQLIGDVLRSDDLARPPGHDAEFLAQLRGRLAGEAGLAAANVVHLRRQWRVPASVAAGFAAVACAVFLVRQSDQAEGTAQQASTAGGGSRVAEQRLLVRDPKLAQYLRAHRSYGDASPAAVPGGLLRGGVETVSLER